MKINRVRLAAIVAAGAVLAFGRTAGATGVADDFESYVAGSFPSPTWSDAGAFDPQPPEATLPSATIENTTDAFGNPTKAMAVTDQVALISGIYQAVPVSTSYSLAADIRVDRYSDNPINTTTDWAMQLTFSQLKENFYATPQAGIYASTLTQGWRVFLIDSTLTLNADIELGVPAVVGTWYRVEFDLDTITGNYRARITDIAANNLLVDSNATFTGWTGPGSALFDSVSFFDGEGSPDVTMGNLAVVDNINVVAIPEPSSIVLTGLAALGLAGGAWRRRSVK